MKTFVLIIILISPFYLIGQTKPEDTEEWKPVPEIVNPESNGIAPSDAVVLFDGKNTDEWINGEGNQIDWVNENGILTVKPGTGNILTKRHFSDCQLHIEWRTPSVIEGEGQGRGNSGIFFQSLYELQVLDSYNNKTYSNGQAGSLYKQKNPLVNASLAPGEWQTYDIIYTAPRFNNDSTLKSPAYITVLQNGILVQNHVAFEGKTVFVGKANYAKHPFKMPLMLQDHTNPVSYRNIWVREINNNQLFNGKNLDGWYTYLDSLGKNNDPESVFNVEDGCLFITGKYFGYISTEDEYENYYLKVVFKWGTKKCPPREQEKRDSGILYHFSNENADKIWPKSIECQIQEGDCGDFWMVGGTSIESENEEEKNWGMQHIFRSKDFENPTGEWNTIELICNGNQVEHYVNGHLVNSGINASVTKGKIALQTEGAEVYYKTIELMNY